MFARAASENSTIQEAMEHVIFYKINAEKGEGVAIAERYHVRGYPTFIALNGQGEVTDRWIGYGGPDVWSKTTLAAAADPRTIPEKKAAFAAGPTAALAQCLANDASTEYDFKNAVTYFSRARDLDPDNATAYTNEIMMNMYYGTQSGAFSFTEVETEAKIALAQPEMTLSTILDLTNMLHGIALNQGEPELALPYITSALKASEGSTDEAIIAGRQPLEINYALLAEKDSAKALTLFRKTMPTDWQSDANQLNRFAWWCFENDVNLEEAQALALKALERADSDAMRSNILDTAAEICNKLGNCDDAVAYMKKAVALNPDKEYFQTQLIRFEKAQKAQNEG